MSLAKLFVEVGADVRKFENGMQNVRSEIDRTSKQASNFAQTINTAIGVGLANAATAGINAITRLGKSVVATGIDFNSLEQNSTLAFETMLGSTAKATDFLNKLKTFAKQTPFELPGLIESSQRLLAFGFDAQKVIPILTSVGDAVAGLGGSPEKLNRVLLALGQIRAKGKVAAGEMLQLTEAGIPAWEMLAKKIGVSIPEAMKLSERGAIDAETAINAVIEGMNKRFGGLMAKQALSWSGMLSNIKDTFTQVTGRVMRPFFELGLKGMDKLLNMFDSPVFEAFVQRMTKGASYAANFIGKIGKGIISLFSGDYRSFFSGLFGGFDKIQNIVSKYENKRFGWLSNFTPKEALTAIKGFIQDLKYGGKNLDYWIKHTPRMLQPIQKLILSFDLLKQILFGFRERMPIEDRFKNIGKLSEFLLRTIWGIKAFTSAIIDAGFSTTETFQAITIFPKILQPLARSINKFGKQIFEYLTGEGLQKTLKKLGLILTGLGSVLSKLVRPFKDALGSLFTQLSAMKSLGFADVFNAVLSSIAKAFSGFLTVIKDEFWPTIKGALVWVWDSLSSFITSINWGSAFNTVLGVFSALYDYVKSIDWTSLWNLIWLGLANINSFLKSTLLPSLGSFFDWLISWFTDTDKSTKLFNAITATWTFVIDWASYIWQGVNPYLSGFFGWLLSWFTDQNKRQQLYGAISTTWNFVVDWASSLWGKVSPYLSSFFSYVSSWFTDQNKRQSLYNGLVSTWTFVKDWAVYLWQWITPYLSNFWTYLISWFTDPNKNAQLWAALSNGWNAVTTWGASLWGGLQPKLVILGTNLKTWIDSNAPTLGSWIDAFITTSTKIKDDWLAKWPQTTKAFADFAATIKTEVPLIIKTMGDLFSQIAGSDPSQGIGGYFANLVTFYTRYFTFLTQTARIALEMLDQMVIATKAAFNFDWAGYVSGSVAFGNKLTELINHLSTIGDLGKGYATGGITKGGLTLVGEKGPELVNLPKGSRVWDHGQSMGKLNEQKKLTETKPTSIKYITQEISNLATTVNNLSKNIQNTYNTSKSNDLKNIYNTKNLNNTSQAYNNLSNTSNNQILDNSQTISKTQSLVNNLSKTLSYVTNRNLSNLFNSSNTYNKSIAFSETSNLTKNYPFSVANTYNTATKYVPTTPTQKIEIVITNQGATPTDRKTIDDIAVALQRRLAMQGNRVVFA